MSTLRQTPSPVVPPVAPVAVNASDALRAAAARALARRSDPDSADAQWQSLATACREQLEERWVRTQQEDAKRQGTRRVHYLSMEFLMGRALGNAAAALGVTLPEPDLLEHEPDAALGNGGLGRLAACFLDAFAELGLPSFGYGLRYRHGMFAQAIQGGRQVEVPDDWLAGGSPWECWRPELRYTVGFGGTVVVEGGGQRRWQPSETVRAQAVDFIVPAHHGERVATLRQWHAEASRPIDFAAFSRGDHVAAGQHLLAADTLNWILYPDDSTEAGRTLRLKQEFLLVSASVQDMLARHLKETADVGSFGRCNAVHLNDTHPALAPAELMRLLLDDHGVPWDEAWRITTEATSYTNHTLMPEALEAWPVRLLEALLPRHLEILYEVNHRFLEQVRHRFPGDDTMVRRLSLVDEQGERRVRMGAFAVVASRKVNGVSALHSKLMVKTLFADHAALWPDRFLNITNGVTPRRWLMQANPGLAALLDRHIGPGWRTDLDRLSSLRELADSPVVGEEFLAAKRFAKHRLAERIRLQLGIAVSPDSLFDVQIKRIHEYKRQLLNVLHVVARYQSIIANPQVDWTPRTVIFSGKAASAYHAAKTIIELIHDVARVVNADPRVGDRLKVVFLPDYGVSLAEAIVPAADLSEQISTAGTEASGTGNMKFALNGALTIGTWDGANIEMAEAMGLDNLFVFGLRAEQVAQLKGLGYDPTLYVEGNAQLRQVIDAIAGGAFSSGDRERYRPLVQGLLARDPYLLMADFADYVETQAEADALYREPDRWAVKALLNVAAMGRFSVDRTVREYAGAVWGPVTGS